MGNNAERIVAAWEETPWHPDFFTVRARRAKAWRMEPERVGVRITDLTDGGREVRCWIHGCTYTEHHPAPRRAQRAT